MDIKWPNPGKYLVAVSGGVDSMVLLDMLASSNNYDLVVAHFNHRLRSDSNLDESLVNQVSQAHGLKFICEAWSHPKPDEASARQARYEFLERTAFAQNADGIITAHHHDDLVETLILNIIRGTGRRGLSPFRSDIIRPLKKVKKSYIYEYAKGRGLKWREDSSNTDLAYARNRIRQHTLPSLHQDHSFEDEIAEIHHRAVELNSEIDSQLVNIADDNSTLMWSVRELRKLPFATLTETLLAAVRQIDPAAEVDARSVEEAAVMIKSAKNGRIPLAGGLFVGVENDTVTTSVYSL